MGISEADQNLFLGFLLKNCSKLDETVVVSVVLSSRLD
jgi:hypothetical protein